MVSLHSAFFLVLFVLFAEILRYKRSYPPTNYSVKVRSYSLLSKAEKYDTNVFQAGGHKWWVPNIIYNFLT